MILCRLGRYCCWNCLDNTGLGEFFGQRISVDEVRAFKPAPVVYR